MIKQPHKIRSLDTKKDIEQLNILIERLYKHSQPAEQRYLTFDTTGVWIDASSITEKETIICENTIDDERRLYTKINGTLRYVVLT